MICDVHFLVFHKVISGHLGWVRCIDVEPGNQWFVTGAADRVIKVQLLRYSPTDIRYVHCSIVSIS